VKITIVLITILLAGTFTVNFTFERVNKAPAVAPNAKLAAKQPGISSPLFVNLTAYTINAFVEGWNSSAGVICSPSGSANCNPGLVMFRGVTTTIKAVWGDCCPHTFSLYTKGFPSTNVFSTDPCSTTTTNGCVAKTIQFGTGRTVTFLFAPNIPQDDFTGLGVYEYYCQIHPDTMHGKVIIYKNPNISGTGVVNILDASALALSFDSTHGMTSFNAAADFDNSGTVDIIDASFLANLFDRPI
jgi:plastocyanin